MTYRINHIHLKAPDPAKTADWYVRAFNFRVVADFTRPEPFGDRFIRTASEDGALEVNISGPTTGQTLSPGDAQPHFGLEHFGFDSDNLEQDIARLQGMGAELLSGPTAMAGGIRIAFIKAPDDVRLELIQRSSR